MASRSYVYPSSQITGSSIISWVMGHRYIGGAVSFLRISLRQEFSARLRFLPLNLPLGEVGDPMEKLGPFLKAFCLCSVSLPSQSPSSAPSMDSPRNGADGGE